MAQTCIWCSKSEPNVTFNCTPHTIPKNFGGPKGKDVCDDCNNYFGTKRSGKLVIEVVLKEVFNISRCMLLYSLGEIGKNKAMAKKPSTLYFDINIQKRKIKAKPSFRFQKGFQEEFALQFRRGFYMIFLEEYHRLSNKGHDEQFSFMREFARFGLGDFPVFYLERRHGAMLLSIDLIKKPEFYFGDDQLKIMKEYGFYEIEFLGHTFVIPVIRNYEISWDVYANDLEKRKGSLFKPCKNINYITDIDLGLRILMD